MSKGKFDLTQGPVPGHINRMLGPFALAVLALLSAGIVDLFYIGQLGPGPLAALGFAIPINFALNSCNIGLGAGTMSALSRTIGRKDYDLAKSHAASALILAVIVLGVLAIVTLNLLDFALLKMGAEPHVAVMAKQYLMISVPGLVLVSVASMSNNILRAHGEANLPSLIMITGAVINIIVDPLLIFGIGPFPRLEVQGAAIATVFGHGVAVLLGLYFVAIKRKVISFSGLSASRVKSAWSRILRVGFPAMITNCIVPIAALIAIGLITRYVGESGASKNNVEIAAFNIATRIETVSLALLYALSACIGVATGQNGGAGLTDRVRQAFLYSYKVCIIWGLFTGAIFWIFGDVLVGLFVGMDPATMTAQELRDAQLTIDLAQPYLKIVPLTIMGYGMVFVTAAGFNALGRPGYGLAFTIMRSLAMYVPAIWVGLRLGGQYGAAGDLGAQLGAMIGAYIGIAITNMLSGLIAAGWGLTRAPMTAHAH